jgi:hypothetical protein
MSIKKRIIITVLLIMGNAVTYSQQNLILNPSLEETHHGIPDCDVFNGVYNYPLEFGIYNGFECVLDWWEIGSVDFFTTKNPPPPNSIRSAPLNFIGYQDTLDEGSYYGQVQIIYNSTTQLFENYKEFSGGYFTESLTQGKEYLFSFYYSLADSSFVYSNTLGVLLRSETPVLPTPAVNYDFIRQDARLVWQIDTIMQEKEFWHKVSFSFTANGGEKMFIIGNVIPDNEINFILDPIVPTTPTIFGNPYYQYTYLDNFSLTEITQTDNVTVANNPGGIDDITTFTANLSADATAKLLIYDEAGRIIAQHTFVQDYEQFYLEPLAGAVYYYSFESSNNVKLGGKIVQY